MADKDNSVGGRGVNPVKEVPKVAPPVVKPVVAVPDAKAADTRPQTAPEVAVPEAREKPGKGNILLFNRWDMSEVTVGDAGLRKYINLTPVIIPRTSGKFTSVSGHKHKVCIVERLINKLMVPGHRGKTHKITSACCCGNSQTITLSVINALEIIEKRTGKNPVQSLVKAMENASPLEEVASYRMGGMIARKAVLISPQRRLDLALRHLTQGAYKITFRSRKPLANVVADVILAAANNDAKCLAISERMRLEKEAEGAR